MSGGLQVFDKGRIGLKDFTIGLLSETKAKLQFPSTKDLDVV
jgi:hypothetical protein